MQNVTDAAALLRTITPASGAYQVCINEVVMEKQTLTGSRYDEQNEADTHEPDHIREFYFYINRSLVDS